jgi:signal transduction histidine kinase
MTRSRWLPIALAPVGIAAVVAGFVVLFGGDDEVTRVAVVNRAVGGSFITCGLVAWWHRPDNGTGPLMTLTGFLYLIPQLLAEAGSDLLFTLSELVANWWLVSFAALVLAFPGGRVTARLDRALLAALAFGLVVVQVPYLAFLPFEDGRDNALMISAHPGAADAIDTVQRSFNTTIVFAIVLVGAARWLRAAPALRRLLLPALAGSLAMLILVLQSYYQLFAGHFIRPSQDVAVLALVSVPLAFLFGVLRSQLARARMANLVVELQRAPDSRELGSVVARALNDPSLELVYWLPGFECYVDADGTPVTLPAEGSARSATPIDHDGVHIAALVHDPALGYEPELLEIVSAATYVALERERLRDELASQVRELAGSRARLVEAGDAARRKLERDLHDGAQQRLVSLAIALRITEDRVRDDPEAAAALAAARQELSESLEELRELARGIHPAVLEHGLVVALESLAARSRTHVALEVDIPGRLPGQVELAAYFVACEALANVGKYAQASRVEIRVSRSDGLAFIEVADDGVGGAEATSGSGLRGLADRVEALGGRLRVVSPAGGGTVIAAEMPCKQPAASA